MRKQLTQKQRFSVLERDNFTCKYCGRKAGAVQLEVDHIVPIKKGGDNSINNLITACFECNRGKAGSTIKEHSENLYKTKMNDIVSKTKEYFYDEWNKNLLGSIDGQTMRLLSIYIGYDTKGYDGKKYTAYLDCLENKSKHSRSNEDLQELEKQFLLGGEVCDKVLEIILDENNEFLLDIIKDVIDDSKWNAKLSNSKKLNHELTTSYEGESYIIKKYTLFPNLLNNE